MKKKTRARASDSTLFYVCGYPMEFMPDRNNSGGCFRFPGYPVRSHPMGCIRIGFNNETWREVTHVIMHECMEFVMCARNLRYHRDADESADNSSAGAVFIMNHDEFQEVCDRAVNAFNQICDTLYPVWKKYKASRGKQELGE